MKRKPSQNWHTDAKALLDEVWNEALATENIQEARKDFTEFNFHELIAEAGATYPYVLLGQVLAKASVSGLNALCLQESSELEGAHDVRMMVKKVVTPWNKLIGKPFPGDNEDPYVNNPARSKNFGPEMEKKARNKIQYRKLLAIVEHVQSAGQSEAKRLLFGILIETRRISELHRRNFLGPLKASLNDVLVTLAAFLDERSNGVRLQIVCYSLYKILSKAFSEIGEVRSHSTNTSDAAVNSVGDVECWKDGKVYLAIEVKDRPLNLADLEATIHKARSAGVDNTLFFLNGEKGSVVSAELIKIARAEFKRGIDINFVEAIPFAEKTMCLLNPAQRAHLFLIVHDSLHELGAHYKHVLRWNSLMKEVG